MKKITTALVAMAMTLGLAGISFAQSTPAPATKTTKEKKAKPTKAKKTKKSISATPSK
jgi:hypothetical protein